MSNITQYEGILSEVDANGNVIEMYPLIKTDERLLESGRPADAAVVGVFIKQHDENLKKLDAKITPQEILLADYNNLTEEEKKNGVYIITDANVTDLSGGVVLYTGNRGGLGETVDNAIDAIDAKVTELDETIDEVVDTKLTELEERVKNMVTYQWNNSTQTLNIVVSQG